MRYLGFSTGLLLNWNKRLLYCQSPPTVLIFVIFKARLPLLEIRSVRQDLWWYLSLTRHVLSWSGNRRRCQFNYAGYLFGWAIFIVVDGFLWYKSIMPRTLKVVLQAPPRKRCSVNTAAWLVRFGLIGGISLWRWLCAENSNASPRLELVLAYTYLNHRLLPR